MGEGDNPLARRLGYDDIVTGFQRGDIDESLTGSVRPFAVLREGFRLRSTSVVTDVRAADMFGLTTDFTVGIGSEAPAVVSTPTPFKGIDAQGNFATGELSVGGVGYRYTLNADNGDPASFQLDVTANGSSTSFTVPWSNDLRCDAFDPSGYDPGF